MSTILGAKRRGEQDYLSIEGAKDQLDQQKLDFLRGIADDTADAPVRFGSDNERLASSEQGALSQLISTIGANSSNRQGAVASLMQALGKTPDFAPLASALGRIGGSAQMKMPGKAGNNDTINGDWWQTMGDMGYLTPSGIGNDF
jgi:hypothetical protein